MSAGVHDLETVRGNDKPDWIFIFENADETEEDFSGKTLVFRATTLDGDEIFKKVTDAGISVAGGRVTITRTVAESRLVEPGRRTQYELEERIDDHERTRMRGFIIGIGGVNDDG